MGAIILPDTFGCQLVREVGAKHLPSMSHWTVNVTRKCFAPTYAATSSVLVLHVPI
jgi:hypothetical protein